jgi:hypothetical protein
VSRPEDYFWSEEKNEQLQAERGLSFQAAIQAVEDGRVIADIPHTNTARFAHQRILIVEIDGYVCAAPYVQDGNKRFLKTIYRSRNLQKFYAKETKP